MPSGESSPRAPHACASSRRPESGEARHMVIERVRRPNLEAVSLAHGKRARLYRLLYTHGPGEGTMLVLPVDQGLEHGPAAFLPHPPSEPPFFQSGLAIDGGYSGVAFHYGIAARYMPAYAGRIPLILKLNGKT